MGVCPGRLPMSISIRVGLLIFLFLETITLVSGLIEDSDFDNGANVVSEIEGDGNKENEKRSVSFHMFSIPKAEKTDGRRPLNTTGTLEVETFPSIYSGSPKIFYTSQKTSAQTYPKHRRHHKKHRHPVKGHGHRRRKKNGHPGHRHHHHKRPPKIRFESETQILYSGAGNNSAPAENTSEGKRAKEPSPQTPGFFRSRLQGLEGSSPKTKFVRPTPKIPTQHPLHDSNGKLNKTAFENRVKAYNLGKKQNQNGNSPNPIKETEILERDDGSGIRNVLIKPLGTIKFGAPDPIKEKDSIIDESHYKISPKNSFPFVVKMTSVAIDDGRKNLTKFGKIPLPTEENNNPFNPTSRYSDSAVIKASITPVLKSDMKLLSDSMKKDTFPQHVFTNENGENVFHPQMSPGELLVPQKKYITMEIKTKTVRLPNVDSNGKPVDDKNIQQLRPISVITKTSTPPPQSITIIKSTNFFISMGNQSRPSKTNKTRNRHIKWSHRLPSTTTEKILGEDTAENKYKTAVQSLQPHCAGGSEILRGFQDAHKSFSEAKGWDETSKSFQKMAVDATNAIGLCFQKMWIDTKNLFGRSKRSSQTDVHKAALEFTDNFKRNVGEPVARFFGDLSGKIATTFGKRSTPEAEKSLLLGKDAEEEFIHSSLTRGARSQELLAAVPPLSTNQNSK